MSYAYSPVAAFKLDRQDDVLTGYAAPQGEPPCLLELRAGDTPVIFAKAARYSPLAAADGLRGGWCGFEVYGVAQAFAIDDAVRLVCSVSGQTLVEIATPPASRPAFDALPLTVLDLLAEVRRNDAAPSMDEVLPFALNHYRRHGARQFIEATYQTFLGRWPDAGAPQLSDRASSDEKRVLAYIRQVTRSDECIARWGDGCPGPFHPQFRYDRTGLV